MIRQVDPPTPRPAPVVGVAAGHLPRAGTRTGAAGRFVRGDLDWIVMKALAKDRQRRYASAIGLADDIERFSNLERVSAGPPTASYRLGKFLRGNRGRVIAASLVLLALVVGVIGTTWGLIEANWQRGIAEAGGSRPRSRLVQKDKANAILLSIFRTWTRRAAISRAYPPRSPGQRLDVATAELAGTRPTTRSA